MAVGFRDSDEIGQARFGQLVGYLARKGYAQADINAFLGTVHGGRTNKEIRDSLNVILSNAKKKTLWQKITGK